MIIYKLDIFCFWRHFCIYAHGRDATVDLSLKTDDTFEYILQLVKK